MIVYDKALLENLQLHEQADSLLKGGFINKAQKNLIEKELPSFKIHNNILIRIGFLLLGILLYFSIGGAISIVGYNNSPSDYLDMCCYIFAIVGLAGCEFLARNNYYRNGLDEAFVFGTILNAGIAVGVSTDGNNFLAVSITVAIVSLILFLRYLHLLSVLVFYLALTLTIGYAIIDFRESAKMILPFLMMLFSIGTYYFCQNLINNLRITFYNNGILLVKSTSLVLLYFSGNYYVVREFSALLIENYYGESLEIPLAWFFWIFTFIVPALYLFFALKSKEKILLWIGLFCLCFSFFTFRTYHHVLPPEVALTLGGLILFAIAYFSIRKLKNKEAGITFKPDRISNPNTFLNAEALIIASTFGIKPEVKSSESPMEFGGGDFSGGGSGGSF
ncbi:hypothetical protein [Flavobacterium salmonis]|uniref:DUF2157 domain-containing protein n=1 Tax=Flavobacterium salmonis TaxID=2654844 RepID=A0A6V6ZAE9_9FLAO|nr:hypothetical protein [Flavobacterium salmonis]CAD0008767.1 hypothetical protein FLAT13_04543 [Flavobacterium salmonis]